MLDLAIIIDIPPSDRLRYICDIVFRCILDLPYRISKKEAIYEHTIALYYGCRPNDKISLSLAIPSDGLLYDVGVKTLSWSCGVYTGTKYLYQHLHDPSGDKWDLPFDFFSMAFFLVSRYEEYTSDQRDLYGRYESTSSLAARYDFLDKPLVDIWAFKLLAMIEEKWTIKLPRRKPLMHRSSIDIDQPYAYKYKSWVHIGGVIKDLVRPSHIKLRLQTLLGGRDPFDTYSWLRKAHEDRHLRPDIYLLRHYQKPYDLNHISDSVQMTTIVKELSIWADLGIHPSSFYSRDSTSIKEDISWLHRHSGGTTSKSRQHFLLVKWPDTFRLLLEAGITSDASLLYHDTLGFRVSTAHPIPWYDLKSEVSTELILQPVQVMDVTLRYYLKLSPDESIRRIDHIFGQCQEVSGSFSYIWHNSNISALYGWSSWKKVYEHLLDLSIQD